MVDYAAVLRRTIDALPKNTPEIRERVYAKARSTVQSKLAMINPAPSQALIDRQMSGLETAIESVEADFAVAMQPESLPEAVTPETDPLMDVLRGLPSLSSAPAQKKSSAVQGRSHTPYSDFPADDQPIDNQPSDNQPSDWNTSAPPSSDYATPDVRQASAFPRLPNANTLEFDELPRQTENFDDIFERQDENQGLTGFAAPTLDDPVVTPVFARPPRPKARSGRFLVPLIGLAVLGGAGVLAYTERDRLVALLQPEQAPAVAVQPDAPNEPATTPATDLPATSSDTGGAPAEPAQSALPKFTQRLNSDGTEIDAGAGTAGGAQSVAQLEPASEPATPPETAEPVDPAVPAVQPPVADPAVTPAAETPAAAGETPAPAAGAIPVGQKAIFYEERTSGAEGSASAGNVVWSVVRESPGNDRPPEAAVRGELSIPEVGLNVRMTLRRNADATLPASHILELIMTVPDGFSGGTIEDVQRVNLKPTEESAGAPLAATPVKVADKYFLVALENTPASVDANLALLRDQSWIDLPVVYRTGRRALFTMEKGLVGDQVFKQVLDAWAAAPLQ